VLLALIAAGVVGGVVATHVYGHKAVRAAARATPAPKKSQVLQPRPLPAEVRGVHVTMALAGLPGKLNEYVAMKAAGLNTIELDVKDENGDIGFPAKVPLARKLGSAKRYYDAERAVATIHAAGLYLVGRVVTFEDPALSAGVPELAIRRADGARWLNSAGLGWTNPYDKRVWKYNVDIAEQAAKLGFDEIQFDYVRFPSDGDNLADPLPGQACPADGLDDPDVRQVRATAPQAARGAPLGGRLRPLGHAEPWYRPVPPPDRALRGRHLSDGLPVPLRLRRVTTSSTRTPARARRWPYSLRDFRKAVRGHETKLIPWLQDFSLRRTYTLADVQDQIQAARLEHTKGFMLWNAAGLYTVKALSTPAFR